MSVVSKSPRWLRVQLVVEAVVKFYSEWGRWVGLSSGPSGGSGKLSVLVFGHQVVYAGTNVSIQVGHFLGLHATCVCTGSSNGGLSQ